MVVALTVLSAVEAREASVGTTLLVLVVAQQEAALALTAAAAAALMLEQQRGVLAEMVLIF